MDLEKFGYVKKDGFWVREKESESKSYKSSFFCPHCKKIMRPLDTEMFEKIGLCLDCQSDLDNHLKATNNKEALKELYLLMSDGKASEDFTNLVKILSNGYL